MKQPHNKKKYKKSVVSSIVIYRRFMCFAQHYDLVDKILFYFLAFFCVDLFEKDDKYYSMNKKSF